MINIAIDGYAGSGKSTIAKALANRLNFKCLDTGAIYRAIACAFDAMGYDEKQINENIINKFVGKIDVDVEFLDGMQHVILNGTDYTPLLRSEKISHLSAKISPYVKVRELVLNLQRQFAKKNNIVMEGRDIGSFVLPDADFKFFCTADEQVRAQRRLDQQHEKGNVDVKFEEVLEELRQRDYADTHRDHGAIKVMPDSIVVDTTNQTIDESVEFCLKHVCKNSSLCQ